RPAPSPGRTAPPPPGGRLPPPRGAPPSRSPPGAPPAPAPKGGRERFKGLFSLTGSSFDTTSLVEARLKKRLQRIVEDYLFGVRSTDSMARSGSMELLFQMLKGSDPYDRKVMEAGDDARLIDWKQSARGGKILTRPPPPDARTFWVLLDASAQSWEGIVDRKWNVMAETAALIGCLTTVNEDLLGIGFLTDSAGYIIDPSNGKNHFYDILYKLNKYYPRGRSDLPKAISQMVAVNRITPRSIVIVLSPFQHVEEWSGGWNALAEVIRDLKKGNRWIVNFRVTDPIDDTLPDMGLMGFQHPETGRTWLVDTHDPDLQQMYHATFAAKNLEITRALAKVDPQALVLSTETTLPQRVDLIYKGLADYLARLTGRGTGKVSR
ncbi:MAG: DUF58 domain-containing protein, partial [Halobacteria archaeon]